jgi:phage gpG-like protein
MFNVQFNAGASRQALIEAAKLLADMTPVYNDIREYMVRVTEQRFQQGVSPDGTAWAPKRPSTIERYKRLGYGSLPKPLIGPSKRLGKEIQGIVSRTGVEIGSSLIYSGVMQDGAAKGAFGRTKRGAPIPWGRIPARTWLGISRQDETAIVAIAEEAIAGTLDAEG